MIFEYCHGREFPSGFYRLIVVPGKKRKNRDFLDQPEEDHTGGSDHDDKDDRCNLCLGPGADP